MHSISKIDLTDSLANPSPIPKSSQRQWCSWGSWASYGETVLLS